MRALVLLAHESPVFEMLPNRDYWREVIKSVEDTFVKEGTGPAMQVFNAGFGGEQDQGGAPANDGAAQGPPEEPGPEMTARVDVHLAEIGKAMEKNMEFFIGYETPPVARYVPAIATLRVSSTRVGMAVVMADCDLERTRVLRARGYGGGRSVGKDTNVPGYRRRRQTAGDSAGRAPRRPQGV